MRLTLSAPLAKLLPGNGHVRSSRTTVQLEASSWLELTDQIRERFPALAACVLSERFEVKPAFVVVVNDSVTRHPEPAFQLMRGDEVYMFAAVAGG